MFPDTLFRRKAARLVRDCAKSKLLIAVAESCTGGYLAKLITDIPGSSEALWGGLVVYSNEAKTRFAGVRAQTLATHGAVSAQTVTELVEGLFASTPADLALAISGVAGPGGGSPEKPVGTVWIAVARRGDTIHTRRESFRGGRNSVRRKACRASLEYLIGILEKPGFLSLDNS
jgi:PncC family amidohydrolase